MIRGWRLYAVTRLGRGQAVLSGVRGIVPDDEPARCGHRKTCAGHLGRDIERDGATPPGEDHDCGYHVVKTREDLTLVFGWMPYEMNEVVWDLIGQGKEEAENKVGSAQGMLLGSGLSVAAAVTSVLVWGKVVPHAQGWRAQYVRPESVVELLYSPWYRGRRDVLLRDLRTAYPGVSFSEAWRRVPYDG